jgi:hypothetical protein
MPAFVPVFTPVGGTKLYVDVSWFGAETGSQSAPFTTIAAAIAVAAAGDVIIIEPGAYVEDLVLAAGEDYDLTARVPGSVTITGSMVTTDATATFEGIDLIDDGAGMALHVTGTAADTVRLIMCQVDSSAGGDAAIEMDNTAGTLEIQGGRVNANVGNANECVRLESGTIDILESDIVHASNIAESVVCEGDAATTLTMCRCRMSGTVVSEAAAANPAMTLDDCAVTVGAVSAVTVAAGNTVDLLDVTLDSSDAAQDAIDGAGTVRIKNLAFLGTADETATTITTTHFGGSQRQHGTVGAAGASPQVDVVTLPQVLPSVAYDTQLTFEATGGGADDVICSIDEGTIATTGFSVVTTSAAAAAIAGNVHWSVEHD